MSFLHSSVSLCVSVALCENPLRPCPEAHPTFYLLLFTFYLSPEAQRFKTRPERIRRTRKLHPR